MPTFQVSEIFYSIQGEGASCGRATAFIRLGGCTLGCQWCDTKYTWRGGPVWEESHILETVQQFPARRVVVTGGEPFEQNIASLLQALDRKSTRLNSSHLGISYAVFCWKKKHGDLGAPADTG